MPTARTNWGVTAISIAGILFMLLGLMALALPTSQEGVKLWELDSRHAVYLMDIAGSFALGLGLALTWLGSRLWNRHLQA
jgi:cytochrome c biogenesis protein CcdA